jgi:hypothetical protein
MSDQHVRTISICESKHILGYTHDEYRELCYNSVDLDCYFGYVGVKYT